ncbi:MAG TPA: N-acetylmuramoyl-L-alanine amidase [Candidatus Rifleibacterium sp.]|nr:N-acetylmuramoyl-L-alanine amidase [Candidatus Rifleibacterium sp.]HPT45538.1 N-acetylmuramoyl-L-alanine amidase [Candidatus Rifleibacterium sp.]
MSFNTIRSAQKLSLAGMLLFFFGMTIIATAQDGYISARSFAESQGIAHLWFPVQKMLVMRKGLKSVKLRLNDPIALVDDKEVALPAAPRMQDGQIMVPAAALQRLFQGTTNVVPVIPPNSMQSTTPERQSPPAIMVPIAQTPAPVPTPVPFAQPMQPQTQQEKPPVISVEDSSEAVLLALRHSSREDHTRVVLEFSAPVTYRTEFKDGTYRLTIVGCRNLIPTKRTNPGGRDVNRLEINSGADRKGLILNFVLPQKEKAPTIETVATPFRMIVSIPCPPNLLPVATATALIATAPAQLTAASSSPVVTKTVPAVPAVPAVAAAPKAESAPEINIEVVSAKLNDESFAGRTVVIDPGHGGSDNGFVFSGRPEEKQVNLAVARHLKSRLEEIGFKAVMTRTSDVDLPQSQRVSFANRHGGDLYISLHTSGSADPLKAGVACYYFAPEGYFVNKDAQGAQHDAAFSEWLRSTRFDLAMFVAKKVNERLVQHLRVDSRGVKALPLLPLKFIMNPAVMVEVGMLSDKTEGKNLISDKYQQAVAQSIANAVVDFFNGIVIK